MSFESSSFLFSHKFNYDRNSLFFLILKLSTFETETIVQFKMKEAFLLGIIKASKLHLRSKNDRYYQKII